MDQISFLYLHHYVQLKNPLIQFNHSDYILSYVFLNLLIFENH